MKSRIFRRKARMVCNGFRESAEQGTQQIKREVREGKVEQYISTISYDTLKIQMHGITFQFVDRWVFNQFLKLLSPARKEKFKT